MCWIESISKAFHFSNSLVNVISVLQFNVGRKWSFSDASFLGFLCITIFRFLIIPKTSDDFIEFLIKLAKNFCANSLKRAPFREGFFGARTTVEKKIYKFSGYTKGW